eukprot:Nk52_evm19s250 gene=Nk52_evmTU19s250
MESFKQHCVEVLGRESGYYRDNYSLLYSARSMARKMMSMGDRTVKGGSGSSTSGRGATDTRGEQHPRRRRQASVLIPICRCDGIMSVLFTLRSRYLRRHKREISFPGGHIDDGESPKEAAVRETHEELGIEKSDIEIIGGFERLRSFDGKIVHAFVGILKTDLGDLQTIQQSRNQAEVEHVFAIALHELLDPQYQQFSAIQLVTRGTVCSSYRLPKRVLALIHRQQQDIDIGSDGDNNNSNSNNNADPLPPSSPPSRHHHHHPQIGPVWGLTGQILDTCIHLLILPFCTGNNNNNDNPRVPEGTGRESGLGKKTENKRKRGRRSESSN